MRAFAIFTDGDGDPVAVRADRVVGMSIDDDKFTVIITDNEDSEGSEWLQNQWTVATPFQDVVNELELCLATPQPTTPVNDGIGSF